MSFFPSVLSYKTYPTCKNTDRLNENSAVHQVFYQDYQNITNQRLGVGLYFLWFIANLLDRPSHSSLIYFYCSIIHIFIAACFSLLSCIIHTHDTCSMYIILSITKLIPNQYRIEAKYHHVDAYQL